MVKVKEVETFDEDVWEEVNEPEVNPLNFSDKMNHIPLEMRMNFEN